MRTHLMEPQEVIAQLCQAWNAAAAQWDPQRLSQLYTDDAVFFGGRTDHSVGRDAVKAYFDSYRDMLRSVSIAFQDIQVDRLGRDAVFCQGFADLSFVLANGKPTQALFRTSWVAVYDSAWRLRLHHFSPVPPVPPIPT